MDGQKGRKGKDGEEERRGEERRGKERGEEERGGEERRVKGKLAGSRWLGERVASKGWVDREKSRQ